MGINPKKNPGSELNNIAIESNSDRNHPIIFKRNTRIPEINTSIPIKPTLINTIPPLKRAKMLLVIANPSSISNMLIKVTPIDLF